MKAVIGKINSRKRHRRLRKKIWGTADRPRLCVAVTNQHLYAQFVDDEGAVTLASATTNCKELGGGKNLEAARRLGQRAAVLAKEKGIRTVVFDRGGFKYHGRVKAVADAVREAGIQF
jgi:large subunit ribosomal protein L18